MIHPLPFDTTDDARPLDRSGMTLIELVSALTGATILMVGMAGTIAIATQQIDHPIEASAAARGQSATALIAADLRHASAAASGGENTLELERTHPSSGVSETITYAAGLSGLTRSTDGGPTIPILDDVSSLQWNTSTSTSTSGVAKESPEILSFQIGASEAHVTSFSVDLPPGRKPGDLLVLAAGSRGPTLSFGPDTWTTYHDYNPLGERLVIATHPLTATSSSSVTITAASGTPIAAAVICIDNAAAVAPIKSKAEGSAFTLGLIPAEFCPAGAPAGLGAASLNLQVFAARGVTWHSKGLRIAGFSELGTVVSNRNSLFGLDTLSFGIAYRHGPLPAMVTTPRVYSGITFWTYSAFRLESQ